MSPAWRRLAREPLLHFLAIGVALFALDHALHGGSRARTAEPEETRRLVVTRAVRDELARQGAAEEGRPLSPGELEARVEAWIDDEILYREGRRRGLERDDPRVRARVAQKMTFVLAAQAVPAEPTEAALGAWLRAHPERFAEPERIDFVHVFVSGEDDSAAPRAQALLAELRAGASPNGLGDPFSGGRHYRRRSVADLAATFGDDFAAGVRAQDPGSWEEHRSRFGRHLVRVERHTAATAPELGAVRADVEHDWLEHQRAEATRRAIAALRARWDVVREP